MITAILSLLLATTAPAAGDSPSAPDGRERLVMILPLRGPDERLAGRLTDRLILKFARQVKRLGKQSDFKVVSKIEVDEAWGQGVGPKIDVPPTDMAKWLREVAAQVALWGSVRREGDELTVRLKGVDITSDPSHLFVDKTYRASGERAYVDVITPIVEELTGHAVRKPVEAGGVPEPDVLGPAVTKNPGFEKGSGETPVGWDRIDGLTTFRIDDPTGANRGKVVKMDTRMAQTQADAWWKTWRAGAPASKAPEPELAAPPYYDSVGGLHGAHYYSDFFPVKPGMRYRVLADFKGKTTDFFFAKVFVKGYAEAPLTRRETQSQRREVWRTYLACRNFENQWKHYSVTFTIPEQGVKMSNKVTVRVKWIRVIPYAYWPIGLFYWDNVKVVEEPVRP